MSKVAIKLSTLTDIGNAVRAKKGTEEQIPVTNLADEIQSIQGGTDTSADTVTAESMLAGVTAHNASGEPIVGTIPTYGGAMQDGLKSYPQFQEKTATENGEVVPDEGYDGLSKVTVDIELGVDTSADTVTAEAMLEGITAHDANGEPITGAIPTYDGNQLEVIRENDILTLPVGGKYCANNIDIQPALQNKTVTQNGTVKADEGYVGLSSVTVSVPSSGGGGGGGTAKGPIVINSANMDKFPVVDDFLIKLSGEAFTREELEKTIIFLQDKEHPAIVSVIAPQAYFEAVLGENYAEHNPEILTITEADGMVQVHDVLIYIPPELDGVYDGIPSGLWTSVFLAAMGGFTIITNYA